MDPLEDHPLVLDIKPKPKLVLSGHPLQIRIDNIPRDQLEIRDMYAVEVSPGISINHILARNNLRRPVSIMDLARTQGFHSPVSIFMLALHMLN